VKQQVNKIIVVFKTHFDLGFTGLSSEIIRSYSTEMLPEVVHTCETTSSNPENHRFVWTMPAWPLAHTLSSGDADASMKERARNLIRQGQIRWHALPFTTHTEFCGLEEFIRGMYFARKLSAAFGFWATAAKMTDVPGHTRMLPSLLNQAGVKFLHLGCNPFSTPPEVPRIFRWEGPDGRQVVTFYNKGDYGSSLEPPDDWPFPVWLALMNTGDNHGPQKPEIIADILREVERTMPGTEVVMGTLDDFIAEIEPLTDILPVVREDLADTWIHGVGTYPKEVGRIRRLRQTLADTEKALAVALAEGTVEAEEAAALKQSIDRAYEQAILFGEHTWGMDIKQMGEDREYRKERFAALKATELYQRIERSWEEKKERVRAAAAETGKALPQVMEKLARSAAGAGGGAGNTSRRNEGLLVFNGLGWERDIWVDLEAIPAKDVVPVDAATGEVPEMRTVAGRMQILIRSVPPLGSRFIRWERREPPAESPVPPAASTIRIGDHTLENRWYRLSVDPKHGVIRSLTDKSTGHEWVDRTPDTPGFGQYRYDVYGDQDITDFLRSYAYRFYTWGIIDFGRAGYPKQEHRTYVPAEFRTETIRGDGSATIVMTASTDSSSTKLYGNAREVSLAVTLYEHEPYIDMELQLKDKEETPFIESGHFLLPIHLPQARASIQKLGQVVDPQTDIAEKANHVLYCCDRWVDIGDGTKGIAIIPLDTPLFSFGESGILRFRSSYEEQKPTLLFNLFNNSWGTNFPQWMGGDYRFCFRLLPHQGTWQEADVPRHAAEAFAPALTRSLAIDSASSVGPFFSLDNGLELLCFKPSEDGEGYVLRLTDTQGIKRMVRLSLRRPARSVHRCSLLEVPLEQCANEEGDIRFETNPFETHTFKIVF
jgi:alpha-mannosidase